MKRILAILAALAGSVAAQILPVQHDAATGAVVRPTPSEFRTGNDLLSATQIVAGYQPIDADLTTIAAADNGTALAAVTGTNTGDQTLPTRASLGIDTTDNVTFGTVTAPNLAVTNTTNQILNNNDGVKLLSFEADRIHVWTTGSDDNIELYAGSAASFIAGASGENMTYDGVDWTFETPSGSDFVITGSGSFDAFSFSTFFYSVATGGSGASIVGAGAAFIGDDPGDGTLDDGFLRLEGDTADGFEAYVTTVDPTADNTHTLIDGSGLVSLKVDPPASATSDGELGMWAEDDSYLYICTAVNTWRRVAIATW